MSKTISSLVSLASGATSILAALTLVGCVDDSDEGTVIAVGRAQAPLYALSTRLWDPGEKIDVCWKPGGSAADKQLVRDIITRTWQARINISFVDWSSCPASGFSGIEITPGTSNVVTGGLGKQLDGVSNMELDFSATPEDTWSQCTTNSLNRADCIQATAIHEFGHSLAFAHEQNRPDNDGQCTQGVGSGSNGDTLLGAFDTSSIMNYCADATKPSTGDIFGAVRLYGMAPALTMVVL
jgi:hypothetical protein